MGKILVQFLENPLLLSTLLFVLLVWLATLTFLFYFYIRHYHRLTRGAKGLDLREILEDYLKKMGKTSKDLQALIKRVDGVQEADLKHIQKVGVVRFNPFEDTGGDQSFAVALLDEEGNGLVISALHGRDKTRMYAKPVKGGSESGYSFSEEEKQAVREAMS